MNNEKNEKVGYCRPPKAHQFKKGQSGNPRGRPRKATSNAAVLARVRAMRIPIMLDGKRQLVTPFEAALHSTIQQCLKYGRTADLERLLKMFAEEAFDWRAEWAADAERGAQRALKKIMTTLDRTLDNDPVPSSDEDPSS